MLLMIGEDDLNEREFLQNFFRHSYKPGDPFLPGEKVGWVNQVNCTDMI
jgi:hypothetical protein